MNLDEIEKLAAGVLTEQWHGQDAVELAEALLAVLPIVKAAEAWHRAHDSDAPTAAAAREAFWDAFHSLRAQLDSGAGKGG